MSLDLGVYVVTDPVLAGARGVAHVVEQAVRCGASIVQLRDKTATTRELVLQARKLVDICKAHRVPLIINDRLDVALAAGADGVHVGQDDMPLADARRLLSEQAIVGVSVRTEQEAHEAERLGASYLAANGVFATGTKTDFGEPLGLEGLARLVRCTRLPVVAIGGISQSNAKDVLGTGCAGIAVVSAVMSASDPGEACRQLRACAGGRSP